MTTLYYDPILDVHHRLPVSLAMTTAFYALAQHPADARRLFDAASQAMGIRTDVEVERRLNPSRAFGSALLMAKEWGLDDMTARLQRAIDASFEPTWDTARGEFTWGMGLDEPHPRGQFNAFLAAAEAGGAGRWTALSAAPLEPCPQIVDVDFPNMAFTRAEWSDGSLLLTAAPLREDPKTWAEFRIAGVEPGLRWTSSIDAAVIDAGTDQGVNSVVVRIPMVADDLEFEVSGH